MDSSNRIVLRRWAQRSRRPQAELPVSQPRVSQNTQWSLIRTDTQRGVVSGLSRDRNLRSKIWWFTEFCNSHYVSHFAAFFIVMGAKISIVNSCIIVSYYLLPFDNKNYFQSGFCYVGKSYSIIQVNHKTPFDRYTAELEALSSRGKTPNSLHVPSKLIGFQFICKLTARCSLCSSHPLSISKNWKPTTSAHTLRTTWLQFTTEPTCNLPV